MKNLFKIVKYIWCHPLNRGCRGRAFFDFLFWQVQQSVYEKPRVWQFANRTKLLISKGQTGATGNIYCGLQDFEEMSFLLHFLREKDLFLDVGANVGAYTVLASGVANCTTYSFEPIDGTYRALTGNVKLNHLEDKVQLYQACVGSDVNEIPMTQTLDTVNHVEWHSSGDDVIMCSQYRLDQFLKGNQRTTVLKVDVEGFEYEVLKGLGKYLFKDEIQVVLIELNGSGLRFGVEDETIQLYLEEAGFKPMVYRPFERKLGPIEKRRSDNVIFVKDIERAKTRLVDGPEIEIPGRKKY